MLDIIASIEGLNSTWQPGVNLIDVEIVLGAGKGASSGKVVVADPGHVTGKALIKHSASIGGLTPLDTSETPAPTTAPTTAPTPVGVPPTGQVAGGNGTVARGAKFTPEILAALDTVVLHEISQPLSLQGYYSLNGAGYFSELDITAGKGFPASAGTKFNVGRYQINRGDWSDAKKANPDIKGFSPKDQDLVALYKLFSVNRGGKQILAGDVDGFLRQAANEWVSIPGGPQHQPQNPPKTLREYKDYYAQRLAYHKSDTTPPSPANPSYPATPVPVTGPSVVVRPEPNISPEVIKGSVLSISVFGTTFQFVHQRTSISHNYVTEVTGQSIRYMMSRRNRSATFKNISLKDLAIKITKSYKLELVWDSQINPTFTHIDQTGITDYALLVREVTNAGLLISEAEGTVVIKAPANLLVPKLTLKRGVNLISYDFKDTALTDKNKSASSLLGWESSTSIDLMSGQAVSIPTHDNTRSGIPGSTTPVPVGNQNMVDLRDSRARLKRLYGLPSTFVVPLTTETVKLTPLDTLLTDGFGGDLDRVWLIDKITHRMSAATTTLDVVSPVDVRDLTPPPSVTAPADTNGTTAISQGDTAPTSGSINERILKAALAVKGTASGDSEVPARVACAWCINKLVLPKAGLNTIGDARVDHVKDALAAGRGRRRATLGSAIPGDIIIMGSGERAHIGVYLGNGKTLSNSSSKATFTWVGTFDDYQRNYGALSAWEVLN